jgi:hypothetical protein
MRPTQGKRKIYDSEKRTGDLRNDNVGLSEELLSVFKICSRMSSEDLENLICLVGQQLTSKIQTLDRTHNQKP